MRAAIFDLDGTLLNTLDDLADATNAALRHFGFPERTTEEVRRFVIENVTPERCCLSVVAPKEEDEC